MIGRNYPTRTNEAKQVRDGDNELERGTVLVTSRVVKSTIGFSDVFFVSLSSSGNALINAVITCHYNPPCSRSILRDAIHLLLKIFGSTFVISMRVKCYF